MRERLSGDGVAGRQHAQPGGALSGPGDVRDTATVETLLAAAVRRGDLDPRAEQRAVAAFRAARATGPHRARTRRRDDWRVPGERRARRPLKMTFGVAFASLALGGVAVAAIGSVASSSHGAGHGRGSARASALAPGRPGGTASPASGRGPRPTGRPASAKDTEAHCRAYEHVQGHGKALDATAWQRLVAAAGGESKVADYCSGQLKRATAAPSRPAGTGKSGKSGKGAAGAGHGASGKAGSSGNGASGNGTGGTDKAAGNGRAGGQGGGKHK
ncbi:hypothetical protein A6P39_021030 [Streptomyces sp. FXJ1.172]|uniref:hypothetical protein n=1 Tax=Streptomyces sp. FXJ1.172 TaxID=710705 RepID=UPI0007D003A7|nr:hypothetical protein [Streptomyces sp. FXJ1.172]WEO96313.1 hypothetical protein A6P39_021030 [Streptomyces sp. FXJ1.172]